MWIPVAESSNTAIDLLELPLHGSDTTKRSARCRAATTMTMTGTMIASKTDTAVAPITAHRYDDDYDDYHDDDDYDYGRRRWREPHRGTLILVLGIVGVAGGFFACLPIFCCPFAWAMGSTDLAKIRAGTMDYAGYSNTQAGYVLGIVGSLLLLGGVALLCILLAAGGFK